MYHCNGWIIKLNPISSDQVFLWRLRFSIGFAYSRSILEIDHILVAAVARGTCRSFWKNSTCPWNHPRQPAWIGIRCDRTGVPKGGRFRSWRGNHGLKRLLMRFDLLLLLCLELQLEAQPDLSRSVYLPNLSLLPPVFSRFDLYLFCVLYLDALGFLSTEDWSYLALLDHLCITHLFHRFDTLGSPLEGGRVPWLRRETCPLASLNELWYKY
jgi:hypothetical protein